jgi:CheY-like chemotaxis protein
MDPRTWRRANVLAVDDQASNLIALDAVLSPDCNVVRATSGEQALSILEERSDIDVILMDIQMPGMDGFEAASRIKKLSGCADIPIVFVTAVFHEDPFVKQGYEVGAVDYFSKPFDPAILRVKVGIYASFRQKSDLLRERERQLKESEALLRAGQRFSAMLECLHMGVIVTDPAGAIRYVNTEAIDLSIVDWWDAEGQLHEGRQTPVSRVLAKGQTAHETREFRGADGGPRSLLCTASPLRERDGTLVGAVVIVRDVTERNRMELDLERRIEQLAFAGPEARAG